MTSSLRKDRYELIYGIGVDIVKISRIEDSIARNECFATRIFTDAEISYCRDKAKPAQHFAANFAVKESFIKAFGEGLSNGMKFHDFELLHRGDGAPYIELSGATREIFSRKSLSKVHVSISHDAEYAIAYIIIE